MVTGVWQAPGWHVRLRLARSSQQFLWSRSTVHGPRGCAVCESCELRQMADGKQCLEKKRQKKRLSTRCGLHHGTWGIGTWTNVPRQPLHLHASEASPVTRAALSHTHTTRQAHATHSCPVRAPSMCQMPCVRRSASGARAWVRPCRRYTRDTGRAHATHVTRGQPAPVTDD